MSFFELNLGLDIVRLSQSDNCVSVKAYTFANDKGYNPRIKVTKGYVTHWSEMKIKSIGLLFWRDVGTGISLIVGCIANALLEQGVLVLII